MIIKSKEAEQAAILDVAQSMCAAARTAPKTKGVDHLFSLIITDEDIEKLAKEMERLSEVLGYAFFMRDADNIRSGGAVVLLGYEYARNGLNDGCQYCNFKNCADCEKNGGVCVFNPMDLGIAAGSAVAIAANAHVDNRIMFSAGRAAIELKLFDGDVKCAVGIPLSVSGKSPFFDRKPKQA